MDNAFYFMSRDSARVIILMYSKFAVAERFYDTDPDPWSRSPEDQEEGAVK
jgi:hypothetical protein